MKVYTDYCEFFKKVGILCDLKYSYGINLSPCSGASGFFLPHRLNELKAYVEKHPEYHIISKLKNRIFFNKPVDNCKGYLLGEGDKNPDIVYAGVTDLMSQFDNELLWNDDAYASDPFKLRKNKRFTNL